MKTYQAVFTSLACLLAVGAITTFAQWSPPTGAPPSGNVPAPINVGTAGQIKKSGLGLDLTGTLSAIGAGNALNIKGGNMLMTNSKIISDSNTSVQDPNWVPPSGVFSNVFSIATDAPIQAFGFLSTANVYASTDLYSGNLASSATGVPALRTLCGQSTDGKVVPCDSGSTGGGSTTTPKLSFSGFTLNDVPVTPTSSYNDLYVIDSTKGHNRLAFNWNPVNANRCWFTDDALGSGSVVSGNFDLSQPGTSSTEFFGPKIITMLCKNDTSGQIVGRSVYVHTPTTPSSGVPAFVSLDTDLGEPSGQPSNPPGGTFRWRQNTYGINATFRVNTNGAPTFCRKKVVAYESPQGAGLYDQPNPWSGAASYNYWSSWDPTGDVNLGSYGGTDNAPASNLQFKCSDFFKSGCNHNDEGARVVDLYIQCYNNQAGQVITNPAQAHARLEWLNPGIN